MRFEQYIKTPKVDLKNMMIKKLCKFSITGECLSEVISMLFDDDVDIGDIADEMGMDIPKGGTAAWEKKRENAKKEVLKLTQQSLKARGLPEKFKVYRGGYPSGYNIIPVSLSEYAAKQFTEYGARDPGEEKPLLRYIIKRSDVIADVAALRGAGKQFEDEQELLVYKSALKNPKKIKIGEYD